MELESRFSKEAGQESGIQDQEQYWQSLRFSWLPDSMVPLFTRHLMI